MIPRIIHYIWLSDEQFPQEVQQCFDSWHRWMPDWQYVLWDMERVQDLNYPWLKEAIAERKWAFAADFIRVYAVTNYGGIYMDLDCLVLRSFDDLLHQQAFIGREWMIHDEGRTTEQHLTSHCFGAIPHHPFFQRCVNYYVYRHFVVSQDNTLPDSLRLDMKVMPRIQSELARQIGYDPSPYAGEQILGDELHVFPSDFFNPCGRKDISYCEHLCLGSWRSQNLPQTGKVTLRYWLRYHIDQWVRLLLDKFGYVVFKKQH